MVVVLALAGLWPAARADSPAGSRWRPEVFDYRRPDSLEVREVALDPSNQLPNTRQRDYVFKNIAGQEVPVLVTLPKRGEGPFMTVLLLHGFGSNRHQVTRWIAPEMAKAGMACVALDFPAHGDREGKPADLFAGTPRQVYERLVGGVRDIRQAVDFAEGRRELRPGVGLVGYSMGSWLGCLAGPADRRVKAMVLMVGGTGVLSAPAEDREPGGSVRYGALAAHPEIRPDAAIATFAPRPLLMQNGRKDVLVPEKSARALFTAAAAPKEIRWYDAGHLLPDEAMKAAAEWLGEKLLIRPTSRPAVRRRRRWCGAA